ncbi:MAG: SDR family NAD(P)-dependent oxidoreductase [Pseudomonadota bacterium]
MTARRALVTGGGSGIGLAVAQALRRAGYDTVIAGRSKARLEAAGGPYVVMDVCDPASIAAGLDKAGEIDIFIAAAGGAATAPVLKMAHGEWDRMLSLNLTSIFHCAQAVIPAMVARNWGRFVAIGSTASVKGYRYASGYAAAKHGVLGFVRSLALELAPTGVTANTLCPGYSDTPLIDGAVAAIVAKTGRSVEDVRAGFAASNPMGRLIKPTETAAAALWLVSEGGAAVNGQAIAIDGGESA